MPEMLYGRVDLYKPQLQVYKMSCTIVNMYEYDGIPVPSQQKQGKIDGIVPLGKIQEH